MNSPFQESDATFIPDEVLATQLGGVEAMKVVCHQLLHMLGAAQLEGRQGIRDSAISKTYPQLELVRVASYQLLQVLESPHNATNAASFGGRQVVRDPAFYGIYPQVTLTTTQLGIVRIVYSRLLQVFGSLPNGSNATQIDGYQILRDSAISQIHQVTLVVTKVKFVLAVCYRLLQIHDTLPSEYHAALPGDHQMLADNASQLLSRIQSPIPETSQLTDVQEAVVSACGGTSSISKKLHCPMEGCDVTFGRLQERKRHLIDVHTPRRQCPFCSYKWSPGRPNKIKTHLTENHQDKPHVLIEIGGQRGQRVVAFLNTLCDAMKKSCSQKLV